MADSFNSKQKKKNKITTGYISSWWFQPIWRVLCTQIGLFPQVEVKIKMFGSTTLIVSFPHLFPHGEAKLFSKPLFLQLVHSSNLCQVAFKEAALATSFSKNAFRPGQSPQGARLFHWFLRTSNFEYPKTWTRNNSLPSREFKGSLPMQKSPLRKRGRIKGLIRDP